MKTVRLPHGTPTATLYYGVDNRETLRGLPAESVQCVVTSPPYFGLRDYGEEGQIGLETTPEAYVESLVEVFQEVRRVLRADGTVWLNLGDSYAAGGHGGHTGAARDPERPSSDTFHGHSGKRGLTKARKAPEGLKPKDLIGIPWRVAFALQADGWYLRSDVIWHKLNPMPESVTDRPTKSHEYVFLLSKSASYFYDHVAVREPHSPDGRKQTVAPVGDKSHSNYKGGDGHERWPNDGRNKRSVWAVPTRSYPGAHFATFPPDLISPMVQAGVSARGCCPACGTPWDRAEGSWTSGCACPTSDPIPCTVLDPFSGSGTTGFVALRNGANYIGLDLNADYLPLAEARIVDEPAPDEMDESAGVMAMFGVE